MAKIIIFLAFFISFPRLAYGATQPGTQIESLDSPPYYPHSSLDIGVDLQYVPLQYKNYNWGNGRTSNEHGHGGHLGIEWIFIPPQYGRLGLGFGTGFGAIRNIRIGDFDATLTTIPLELYLSYRLEYFHHQPVVPFAKFGVSNTFALQRGIESREQWYSYQGLDYGFGGEICLSGISPERARVLDLNQGINGIYLIFEYLKSSPLKQNQATDLSHEEYRMGLRFEI